MLTDVLKFLFQIEPEFIKAIVLGIRYTIIIALFSALFGFIIGTILAIMKSSIKPLQIFANIYTDVFRGTPMLLQLALMYYVIFGGINLSPVIVAIVAFSLNSGAYISEIMRSGIQNVDKGQVEAALSMGVSNKDIALDIIIPQAIRKTLPPLINEFAVLIKESSIVYLIGVADIMYHVTRATTNTYQYFGPLILSGILYYILVKLVTLLGKYVEKELSYDRNKKSV